MAEVAKAWLVRHVTRMAAETKEVRQLGWRTTVAYVRLAATVVIAVAVRLCVDCVGIIITDQEPMDTNFWFGHCNKDGQCVLAGMAIFLVALVGCSLFAWSCQGWVTDPGQNPYARRFSFSVIVDASTWIPISILVGKTNIVVEWFMDIAEDDVLQAFLSSVVALVLTLLCALLTHFAMKYCHGVQRHASSKEAGGAGFGKFLLLATLYCLGWAVGWSIWDLVLSLMDALEPGRSMHRGVLAASVISLFLLISVGLYLRYGPEPIIPDPQLQLLCYNLGYANSVWRSLVSYMVYSCMILVVMACVDPDYGLLVVIAKRVCPTSLSSQSQSFFDIKALLVLCVLASLVTALAALTSAAITRFMKVDESSSMRLSRSVHNACQRMVRRRRSSFDIMLSQVLEDGTDARFVRDGVESVELREAVSAPATLTREDEGEEDYMSGGADDAAGIGEGTSMTKYRRLMVEEQSDQMDSDFLDEINSERQLTLNPGPISRALCASVLVYDVLGLVVCVLWGMIAIRCYTVVFGQLAAVHDGLYALTCLGYAAAVPASVSRLVFAFFPSREEIQHRDQALSDAEEFARRPSADVARTLAIDGARLPSDWKGTMAGVTS